jgi:hypothetical protein
MTITYDTNADPNIIFKGLKFKLKKFDFDKDLIFQNMTKVKLEKDKLSFYLMTSYEFNYDNIIEKLKELFPNGEVLISSSMFIQLYLYIIKNKPENKFIFKRRAFESSDNGSSYCSVLSEFDKNTHMLYSLYINNYSINDLLRDVKCFYDHILVIKVGINSDGIEVYTGLTPEGLKTMTISEWAKYLKLSCKEFFIEKQRTNDIEYESESRELIELNRKELDEHINLYSIKKKLETLNNYYDIGYFDIWEFSNVHTKIALNTNTNKMINIK